MKKIRATLYLLAAVTALVLVATRSTYAKETKLDLEERVRTLEIQADISGQHIRALESAVDDLKGRPEARSEASASDLEARVSWLYADIPRVNREQDELAKRVKHLEREQFIEHTCAEPTAKQRAEVKGRIGAENQAALARSDKRLCLLLRATPE
jgi:chromosome segregation ATPase